MKLYSSCMFGLLFLSFSNINSIRSFNFYEYFVGNAFGCFEQISIPSQIKFSPEKGGSFVTRL